MNVSRAAAEAARLSTNGEGTASISCHVSKNDEAKNYELFYVQIDKKGYNSFDGFDQCFDESAKEQEGKVGK